MNVAYLCDFRKNEECPKTHCHYMGTGKCRHTTDIRYAIDFECSKYNKEPYYTEKTYDFQAIDEFTKPQVSEPL